MIDTVKPIAADQTVLEGLKGVTLFMFKKLPIFTKLMFVCSSIILVLLLIGFIIFPFISGKMENSNYCLTDFSEMSSFEDSLIDKGVPYEKISDTVINVPKEWSAVADDLFQDYNKS